jgi:hypothetical protein
MVMISGNPATGDFSDAMAIRKFGEVPDDCDGSRVSPSQPVAHAKSAMIEVLVHRD